LILAALIWIKLIDAAEPLVADPVVGGTAERRRHVVALGLAERRLEGVVRIVEIPMQVVGRELHDDTAC
jgi:hypothetical protein